MIDKGDVSGAPLFTTIRLINVGDALNRNFSL